MFLTARLFMYQQVYFHRTVRAIDLDLAEVFGPSIRAIFGDGSPADALAAYADLDEYALLHQAALWARGEAAVDDPAPGDGTVTRGRRRRPGGRSCCAGRAGGPRPRSGPSTSPAACPTAARERSARASRAGSRSTSPMVDARPAEATATDSLLAIEGRDGRPAPSLAEALARLPAYSLIARRYRRTSEAPTARRWAEACEGGVGVGVGRSRRRERADGPALRQRRQDEQRVDPGDLQPGYFVRCTTSGRSPNRSSRAG